MKKTLIITLLLTAHLPGFSQEQDKVSLAQDNLLPKVQVHLAYFGEFLTHQGVRAGVSTPITQHVRARKDNVVNKAWMAGGFVTYYHHRRNHKGLMFTGTFGRQRIGRAGLIIQWNAEAGYMASFLDGEVYEWNGSEIVQGRKGSSHLVAGLNGGIGWSFDKKLNMPVSFLINPHVYIQAPYNTLVLPRVALEGRLTYYLK